MTYIIPPPEVSGSQRMRSAEAPKSAIPALAVPFLLPVLLPFWAIRFVYRKFTGYEPPPPRDVFVPDPEELAAAIDAICTGSGRAVDSTSDTCPVCDQGVRVSSGLLLTHSR